MLKYRDKRTKFPFSWFLFSVVSRDSSCSPSPSWCSSCVLAPRSLSHWGWRASRPVSVDSPWFRGTLRLSLQPSLGLLLRRRNETQTDKCTPEPHPHRVTWSWVVEVELCRVDLTEWNRENGELVKWWNIKLQIFLKKISKWFQSFKFNNQSVLELFFEKEAVC